MLGINAGPHQNFWCVRSGATDARSLRAASAVACWDNSSAASVTARNSDLQPPPLPDSAAPFDRAALERAEAKLLRDGRWANARVSRVEAAGRTWVVKDFSRRALWVRLTVGRILLGRELRVLRQLAGIDGVPQHAFRVDGDAIAAEFIPGTTLGQVPSELLNVEFFVELERLLNAVHERGIVHLDTGGTGNMLRRPDGSPALIDFQAALDTRWMPGSWRRWLDALDMLGVYKKWIRHDPESMGPARRELYERMKRRRRLWVLRGYAGAAKRKPTSGSAGPT